MKGKLIIFSAPSGTGKSTIINWLMQEHIELKMAFSISCTSRAPRGTERNGVEYFFLTPDEFRSRIEAGEFLEYEEVYTDRYYGTLKSQVERQCDAGQNVVFDVDVKGGCNIKQHYGDKALSIFIMPPSVDELRRRLESRATDAPEVIDQRIPEHGEDVERLAKNRILIDADPETKQRKLLQIFTQNAIGPIFFEIIQRKGNEGFGEGNFQALFESIERDQMRRGVL